jgi:tight adherence protein C
MFNWIIFPVVFMGFFLFFLSVILFCGASLKARGPRGPAVAAGGNILWQLKPLFGELVRINQRYSFSAAWLKKNKPRWDVNLRKAGLQEVISAEEFLVLKQIAPVLTLAVLFMIGIAQQYLVLSLSLSGFVFFLPDLKIKDIMKARSVSIQRNLPEMLDTVVLVMAAGIDFPKALDVYLHNSAKNPLSDELILAIQDVKLGKPLTESLSSMARRVDHISLTNLVAVILQSERTGAPLSEILRAQSDDLRRRRFQIAEELGQKAPLKMLAPLLLLIFPNVFVILLAPLALNFFYRR